jgi:hypothetical protein
MTVVQCLVQQFPDQVVFARGANTQAVQRVIRRGPGVGITELDKELAQFSRRKARPDDRTMQRRRDVPDLGPSALGIGQNQRRRLVPPAKQEGAGPRMVIVVDDGKVRHGIIQDVIAVRI